MKRISRHTCAAVLCALLAASCIPTRDYLLEKAPQISIADFRVRSIVGGTLSADMMLSIINRYEAEIPLSGLDAVVCDDSGATVVSARVTTNTSLGALSRSLVPVSLSLDTARMTAAAAHALSRGTMLLTVRGTVLLDIGRRVSSIPFEQTVTVVIPRVSIAQVRIDDINPIAGRVTLGCRLAVENNSSLGKLTAITYTFMLDGNTVSSASVSNISLSPARSEFDIAVPVYTRVASAAFGAILQKRKVVYLLDAVMVYAGEFGENAVPYRFEGSLGGQ